ncbi:MAG: hypothetical protein ACRDPO_12235, partial [Streptosporangiaceae bacterium]
GPDGSGLSGSRLLGSALARAVTGRAVSAESVEATESAEDPGVSRSREFEAPREFAEARNGINHRHNNGHEPGGAE